MTDDDRVRASLAFTDGLLRTHRPMPRSPQDPVNRCECGRAAMLCEINSAARDAGLITPLAQSGPPPSGSSGTPPRT